VKHCLNVVVQLNNGWVARWALTFATIDAFVCSIWIVIRRGVDGPQAD
jgi:hypothetical protein